MFDVRRLRLLRELSGRGTIAATATACSLTPSAVSQQLALLEREVGTALFVRDGRYLALTQAAHVLVGHTERILAELEEAAADVAGLGSSVAGTVRLAAFPTAASAIVPAAIAACRARHPDLRIVLEEWEAAEAVAAVKAGHLDVALVYRYNLLPAIDDAGVDLVHLVDESLLAAVPADGLPSGTPRPEGPLALSLLRDEPWIAPGGDAALRAAMERACGIAGFSPKLDYTTDDYTVVLALVRAGLGVTVVPQLALELLTADVQLLGLAEPAPRRTVAVALRAGSRRNPAISGLVNELRIAADGLNLAS